MELDLSPELQEAEEALSKLPPAKRIWALPIFRTLDRMGGSGKPKDVKTQVLSLFSDSLSEAQQQYVYDSGRIGWTRKELVDVGMLGGEYGVWALTPLSRAYLDAHQGTPLKVPQSVPESRSRKVTKDNTEVVAVSDYKAYQVPILQQLKNGRCQTRKLVEETFERLQEQLLPGDLKTMPRGQQVAKYRIEWTLTKLFKLGEAKNPARGFWEITEKGRHRLEQDTGDFDITQFQGYSKSKVLKAVEQSEAEGEEVSYRVRIGPELFGVLERRLQLERGPTPADPSGLTRNLVFYGPPGTGKTHVAKLLARALTSEESPDKDGYWRIVQFHPSYAYEDFIQGLRPNLEHTTLTYTVSSGPFLQLCQNALDEPDKYFVLIIDEINRGDPARIFGELLYALEYRGEEVELPLGDTLCVPPNLILLGTMNSVDRSVALVDYALRRRFGFVRVEPDPDVVAQLADGEAEQASRVLELFNRWISEALDKEHVIGHSFFLNPSYHPFSRKSLSQIWEMDIQPLLEEYFFGDSDRLKEAKTQWDRAIVAAFAVEDDADS